MKRALVRYFLLMLFDTPDLLTLSVYKEEITNSIRFVNFVTIFSDIAMFFLYIKAYYFCVRKEQAQIILIFQPI